MSGVITVLGAGRPTPAPPKAPVTSPASGRRPPELDDADWLRARYRRDGDLTIALELKVARGTVRAARERLGISSAAPGRRRGGTTTRRNAQLRERIPAAAQIAARITAEQRPDGPPPTLSLAAARVRAVHQASLEGDRAALKDALVSLGSAAGLVLDHLQALEAA